MILVKEGRGGESLILGFNRKGQVFLDIVVITIVLLVTAMIFIFLYMVNNEITTALVSEDEFNSSTVQGQMLNNWDSALPITFDNVFIIMFVLFWIFIIVSSIFIDSHPVFIIITLIFLIVLLTTVGVFSNAYESFIMDGDIYTFSTAFPKMNYVMEHLLLFAVFMSFSGLIAIFGKNRWGI